MQQKKSNLKDFVLIHVYKIFTFLRINYFLILTLVINFCIHLNKSDKRLNEIDGFRQTQTALGIKSFINNSLNPFSATLPIAGPGSQLPFEFPLFQIFASFFARFISNLDSAARLAGLTTFLLSSILLYYVAIIFWNRKIANVSLLIFSFSAFTLQWASSSMIEFTAISLVLSSVIFLMKFIENQQKIIYIIIFFLVLTLAFLVKLTTALPWIFVLLIMILLNKNLIEKKSFFYLVISFFATFFILMQWVNWTDEVKSNQEFWGPGLTSSALFTWNFGTLEMRLDLENILSILSNISDPTIGSVGLFLGVLTYRLIKIRQDLMSTGVLLTALSGPIIFFPLYGHLYYSAAIFPAVSLLVSVSLMELIKKENLGLGVGFVIVLASYTTPTGQYYLEHYFKKPGLHDVSADILANTESESVVMLRCNDDWSSEYLYYADREGLMLRYVDIVPQQEEWGKKYNYLAFCNEGNKDFSIVPENVIVKQETNLVYKIIRK